MMNRVYGVLALVGLFGGFMCCIAALYGFRHPLSDGLVLAGIPMFLVFGGLIKTKEQDHDKR